MLFGACRRCRLRVPAASEAAGGVSHRCTAVNVWCSPAAGTDVVSKGCHTSSWLHWVGSLDAALHMQKPLIQGAMLIL